MDAFATEQKRMQVEDGGGEWMAEPPIVRPGNLRLDHNQTTRLRVTASDLHCAQPPGVLPIRPASHRDGRPVWPLEQAAG